MSLTVSSAATAALNWWVNTFFPPDLMMHHRLWFTVVGRALVGMFVPAVVVVAAAYAVAFAAYVVIALTGKTLVWALSRRQA